MVKDPSGPKVKIDNVEYDFFYGTGYHNFQDNQEILEKARSFSLQYGFKPGMSQYKFQSMGPH